MHANNLNSVQQKIQYLIASCFLVFCFHYFDHYWGFLTWNCLSLNILLCFSYIKYLPYTNNRNFDVVSATNPDFAFIFSANKILFTKIFKNCPFFFFLIVWISTSFFLPQIKIFPMCKFDREYHCRRPILEKLISVALLAWFLFL